MCFTNDDCDWSASICEIEDVPCKKNCNCFECRRPIFVGEPCQTVFMQESEECRLCGEDSDVDPEEVEEGHQCDYGETFRCTICEGCIKLRAGIKAYELKEGCPEWSSQPPYGDLSQEMHENSDNWDYAEAAVALYPELVDHPMIVDLLEADE